VRSVPGAFAHPTRRHSGALESRQRSRRGVAARCHRTVMKWSYSHNIFCTDGEDTRRWGDCRVPSRL